MNDIKIKEDIDRREFLKIASVSTLLAALGGLSTFQILSPGDMDALAPETVSKTVQWGMVVDMNNFQTQDQLQKCIDACHSIHNVPQFDEPRHEIKWIWKENYEHAFPEQAESTPYLDNNQKNMPFLLLCNHCTKPACVPVCPTQATWKREEDGIVMMDMHRCIGCRFCMAACPYGSRSFNFKDPRLGIKKLNKEYPTRTIGVVEKCNFCVERLAKGLNPACVEVAPNGALVFGNLADEQSNVRKLLRTNFAAQRKPEIGTRPNVYYVLGARHA